MVSVKYSRQYSLSKVQKAVKPSAVGDTIPLFLTFDSNILILISSPWRAGRGLQRQLEAPALRPPHRKGLTFQASTLVRG